MLVFLSRLPVSTEGGQGRRDWGVSSWNMSTTSRDSCQSDQDNQAGASTDFRNIEFLGMNLQACPHITPPPPAVLYCMVFAYASLSSVGLTFAD